MRPDGTGNRGTGDGRGDGERPGTSRRQPRTETADIDGVIYRLGRLQRVLVDVRAQVRELRTYASGGHVDDVALTEAVVEDLNRRLARVGEALDAMRDDYDLAHDAIDRMVEVDDGAQIIPLQKRSMPYGA